MRRCAACLAGTLALAVVACQPRSVRRPEVTITPPVARVAPTELERHGHVRRDDYYWLRNREDPAVIAHLEAENDYTARRMAHLERLERKLFEEITGRLEPNDESVPYRLNGYYYYQRFEKGQDYRVYCRKRGALDAPEEVMLDANELARGHDYFDLRSPDVSSSNDLLAYAVDTVGRRIYTIHFRNLASGERLETVIPGVTGNLAWAEDNRTLFYAKQHPETLRSYQIWRHVLGTDPTQDELVHEEADETFSAYVWKTKSRAFVIIGSFQTLSNEYRFLDASQPGGEFTLFLPRERDHEYSIDHYGDHFYLRTNWEAKNFRLMRTPVARREKAEWEEVIAHRDDVLIEDFEIFRDHLVVEERREGLIDLLIRPFGGAAAHYIDFGERAYLAYISTNPEFDTGTLRFGYSSLTTPNSIFDYDMVERGRALMKRDRVLGDFDPERYRSERLHAQAADGKRIPISLVYRTDLFRGDGTNPLLLYAYGSYGSSIDASFRSDRLSLLDRGFVFAIAHVRGGEELGRVWYEEGRLLHKKNTFSDFIACGEHLLRERYADPERLYAMGGSAGGLLVGAVVNMRPDLFRGAIAVVPFVDVVTTMLDDGIPLTTAEYDEWGDPHDERYYEYMLSYSPYDNVQAKAYPPLLVTAGLHDSQVQYWEPAKWVAKLRATKTDDNALLLKTNMEAGHSGTSGRYRQYKDTATYYAFLLDLAGRAAD